MKLDVIKLDVQGGWQYRFWATISLALSLVSISAPRRAVAAQQCAGGHPQGKDPSREPAIRRKRSIVKKALVARVTAIAMRPIFRGGGIYKGPTPRSHGHDLPKKVRQMGLEARAVV